MIPYLIKSWRGGISDENAKGIAGSFKFGHSLDIHSRDDVLKCNSSVVTLDESAISGLINFFVPASDGTTYAFGANGSIYSIAGDSGDNAVNFVYNDENGAIKGAEEWKLSDGNNYLFWATNTSVARVALNGALPVPWGVGVATQDYKTTLDSAEWHTMKKASGELMIANGNYLATIDYAGNFSPADLNLIPGSLVKCLEERDDYVIIGSEKQNDSDEGYIWSWIVAATNWIQKKRIPVKGVNAIINTENMVIQGGTKGELFYSDFVNSVPLSTVPGGGQANPGGVSIEDGLALFGIYGGSHPGLWSYGRKHKNRPSVLNFEHMLAKTVAGSSISTIGAVVTVNDISFASWGTTDGSTSDYGVDMVNSTTRATALYEGLEFNGGSPHLKKGFDTVVVSMLPLPTGTSFSIKYRKNKKETGGQVAGGWNYAVTGGSSTTFSTAGETEAIFSIGDSINTYELGVELNPSGSDTPEITALVTYITNTPYDYA